MIIRTPKNRDNPYVQINKFALGDGNLSWKAKGLLAYLLSLPDNWEVHPREIARHASNGEKSTYSGIRELIKFGYLERVQAKGENNRFLVVEYVIHEFPILVSSVFSSVPVSRMPKTGTRGKIGGFRAINDFEEQKFIQGERGNVDDFAGMLDDE